MLAAATPAPCSMTWIRSSVIVLSLADLIFRPRAGLPGVDSRVPVRVQGDAESGRRRPTRPSPPSSARRATAPRRRRTTRSDPTSRPGGSARPSRPTSGGPGSRRAPRCSPAARLRKRRVSDFEVAFVRCRELFDLGGVLAKVEFGRRGSVVEDREPDHTRGRPRELRRIGVIVILRDDRHPRAVPPLPTASRPGSSLRIRRWPGSTPVTGQRAVESDRATASR